MEAELVRSIHIIVMDGLIERPGDFRIRNDAHAGYSITYSPPTMISRGLTRLVVSVNDAMARCASPSDAMRIAVVFLERFLLIHPFVNGNGRVALLLMHVLLHPFLPVPLTIPPPARPEYLDALDDAHNHMNYDRILILVLHSAARHASRVEWLVHN